MSLERLEDRRLLDGAMDWSSYLGGSKDDRVLAVAADVAGGAWVVGETDSPGWVSGGFDQTYNGGLDAFVARFGARGELLWATYLGGPEDDSGQAIALDAAGNAWVAGWTRSANWASGASGSSYQGGTDGFVVKISYKGELLGATYLGGDLLDEATGIAVSEAQEVWVTGKTYSPGWISGGFDTSHNGDADAFVARVSLAHGARPWASYLGGREEDTAEDIAIDASGAVWVTGATASAGWAKGGFNSTLRGASDAFVARIVPTGKGSWSSYLGGTGTEAATAITLDAHGNAAIVGWTRSAAPWAHGGFDTSYHGGSDAFVASISPEGKPLWSGCLGGAKTTAHGTWRSRVPGPCG